MHQAVQEVIECMTADKGVRALTEAERKPIMRSLGLPPEIPVMACNGLAWEALTRQFYDWEMRGQGMARLRCPGRLRTAVPPLLRSLCPDGAGNSGR